ncbi:MAG: GAF domain-containing protein, partial [Alphaproteobacteria bacterium]|nr:GAF domain-containing protein [Alphaproteobacteria bacterium]
MVAAGSPRILLRRLREIMAEQASAQVRLDKLVMVIAANMVAEVCSIYLRRAGNWLELFATEGLNRAAVHRTRMRWGEGLVGLVADAAEPINLSNAVEHPRFAYRPETGEDPYRSFLGVPIVRGGQVYGVLTVQNRAARQYDEEEVEALQTVAMVLAEVVAHGALFDIAELDEPELRADRPRAFKGDGLSEGVAVGHVVLHEPRVRVDRMIADDPAAEITRLDQALDSLRASVDEMLESSELDLTGESREVIEAYRLFALDQGWQHRLRDAVDTGLTAEAAVERVQDELRLRIARASDPILRERLHDLDDLHRRLQRHLGKQGEWVNLPADAVLVARALGPAELLDYGRVGVVGLILEDAATTSHVAIVARAMRIPVVGGVAGVTDGARAGDTIAVDGETGEIHLRPPAEIVTAFRARQTLMAQRFAEIAKVRDLPAVTRDGVPISLMMNAGLLLDMPHLAESGADGVGLFRTELQFMIGQTMPRLGDQIAFYKSILEAARDRPVTFRALDLGGDKILPYGRWEREENPALGWRAIRIALDRPALLRYQVRALLAASAGRVLRLLLPMVSDVSEFNMARALVDRELERGRLMGQPLPKQTLVGAMLEV